MKLSHNINTKADNVFCPCCEKGEKIIDKKLITMFELLRSSLNEYYNKKIGLKISSGYRCKEYNKDLKRRGFKASSRSRHMRGMAFDVHPIGITPQELVMFCMKIHSENKILTGELVVYDWGVHFATGSKRFRDFRS